VILSGDPHNYALWYNRNWPNSLVSVLNDSNSFTKCIEKFIFLDISLMERLMLHPPYKRDDRTSSFNQNYIVQLTRNYRSHAAILKPSNELFYKNELIPCASTGMQNRQSFSQNKIHGRLNCSICCIS
jgi:hypothetical protein